MPCNTFASRFLIFHFNIAAPALLGCCVCGHGCCAVGAPRGSRFAIFYGDPKRLSQCLNETFGASHRAGCECAPGLASQQGDDPPNTVRVWSSPTRPR
eukprot:4995824-Prymnesium_polylepis.3